VKKIINVGFAPANEEETPQVNDVAAKVQPSGSGSGSGSGDGSGSGSGTSWGNTVSARGVLLSSYGGKWDANGTFYLSVDYSCDEEGAITSLLVQVTNVQVLCQGVPTGSREPGGTYYAPETKVLLLTTEDFSERKIESPDDLKFDILLPSEEFKTVVTEYDAEGKPTTVTKTKRKTLTISLEFRYKLILGTIKIDSCTIS
jgi:hypothetical protein